MPATSACRDVEKAEPKTVGHQEEELHSKSLGSFLFTLPVVNIAETRAQASVGEDSASRSSDVHPHLRAYVSVINYKSKNNFFPVRC